MSFDISISSDNMVASINYLAITNKDADIISFSFILSQLTQRKITYGIATEAIKKAVDEYQNDQKEIKNLVVSQGTLPIHGENGQIKCNFNSSLNDPEEYLKNQNLEQLTSYGENLVKTNQEIVEELEPTPGKDGCDIFGKILPARSGKKVSFDFDFTVDKRGNKFYANITGIACLTDNSLKIFSPILISSDKMRADLVTFPVQSPKQIPSPEDMDRLLAYHEIKKGVNRQAIISALRFMMAEKKVKIFNIAAGQAPVSGDSQGYSWKIDTSVSDVINVVKNLNKASYEEVEKISRNLVSVNDIIADKSGMVNSSSGWDLTGKELKPQKQKVNNIYPGKFVEKIDDTFISKIYGIAQLSHSTVDIIRLLDVTDDRMEAVIHLLSPAENTGPQSESDIIVNLRSMDISNGIDHQAIKDIIKQKKEKTELVISKIVAKGIPPIPGEKSKNIPRIEMETSAGKVGDDGKIDFRERSFVHNVRHEDVVAEKVPEIKPVDGFDIKSNQLKAGWNPDPGLTIGQNIDTSGENLYVASIDGIVSLAGNQLNVFDVINIAGDIDFKVGNLDANGGITIGGSIRPNFTVKAKGDISINKLVDNAVVISDCNVTIRGGVTGKGKSEISCQGNMASEFINNSKVNAKGNIQVGDSIYNSRVTCEGRVIANSKHGTIVGGEVFAANGIDCKVLGSNTGTLTTVGIKLDAHADKQLKEVTHQLKLVNQEVINLQKILGEDFLKRPLEKLATVEAGKRKTMIIKLKQLSILLKQKAEFEQQKDAIVGTYSRGLTAKIKADVCYPGVVIVFNDKRKIVNEEIKAAVFFRDYKDDKIKTE